MVIKGRSRGNGAQLADYLLGSRENDRAQVLDVRGTSRPRDLKKSLLEMSLSSELTKGVHGLYHAQINPAIGEDQPMSQEDWLCAVDILEKHLGFSGQKRVIVLHEKKGRIHAHVAWERYNHDSGTLIKDGKNYKKHDAAREEIEKVLEHQRTPQKRDLSKKPDIKQELSDLWKRSKDGHSFVQEAVKAGYQIAVGDDRRPWRVITPEGESLDLVRQLDSAKTKDVRERLQPIRDELKTEADALAIARAAVQKEKERAQTVKSRDISESLDLAQAMLDRPKPQKERFKGYSYNITVTQTLSRPRDPEPEKQLDKSNDLSSSQELADGMLKSLQQIENEKREAEQAKLKQPDKSNELSKSQDLVTTMLRKRQQDKEKAAQEAQERAIEQAKAITAKNYYNPITGQEMTKEAYDKMQEFLERQKQREHDRKNRNLGYDR